MCYTTLRTIKTNFTDKNKREFMPGFFKLGLITDFFLVGMVVVIIPLNCRFAP